MESKILKLNSKGFLSQRGFTLVELYIVMAIIVVMFLASYIILNPFTLKQKTRDDKRLSDISTLDRAINEYFVDTATYPDIVNTLRKSNTIPTGSTGPVENSITGWINQDLSPYTTKLPTDPVNDSIYYYSYKRSAKGYEIDAKLEYYSNYSRDDGGNDSNLYETGIDLTVM
ncbi:hypothetical protein A3H26_00730 [candidate division WWE3 bacterium RIFCSPLOWO2_12_FULL_36_10]|uniref:Type II secretion system protein GspG C-terminal domain-containing protein n=1 Tax=candidate division WWE3 bacterium RIFCSPLOWO2_12_FULL_36_10 TaxID=1802630 RepID=A0A1F4VKP3_UNCKA|nr:MAG: hypothetical protein A3H26_00730 [candidate division WWE3 bacterium RIFCSPLOWO2_12_FULL_36_10]